MTGASNRHDLVVTNIIIALGTQLRGTRCRPATADLAVRTRLRFVRRPDVTVNCGDEPRGDVYDARSPKLVVEALAPSSSGVAWQRKLEEYRRLEGLDYILLVDTRIIAATLYARSGAGWETTDADDRADILDMPAQTCRLALSDISDGLTFGDETHTG